MRSFASWIRVDIHWMWGLSSPSLGSPDHCLHYYSIFGDMIFLSCTNMSWSSFFAPPRFSPSFPIISFHAGHSIFIPFLHRYTFLICYPLHIHPIVYWQPDHFSFLLYFFIDTFVVCYRVCWLARLFCILHLIHEDVGFDHWVLELSFPLLLSPYYPKPTLQSMS